MDRRGFLRRGALAGAGALIMQNLFAREILANDKINVGIIGSGGQGCFHALKYMQLPEFRVVAVCDVNANNSRIGKNKVDKFYKNKECKIYGDFRELLADTSIDAVSITVPDHWHAIIAVSAIKAGKHIYLEKPFAYSIYEGAKILEALAAAPSVVLQFGSQQRSMTHFKRAKYLVENGYIGNVIKAVACSPYGFIGGDTQSAPVPEGLDYDFWLGAARHVPYTPGRCNGANGRGWYQIRDYSGGWVTAWGSHHVDSGQWIIGKDNVAPVKIEAKGEFPKVGVYDVAWKFNCEYTYADGKQIIFTTPQGENKGNVWIIGDEGWVSASRGAFLSSNPALARMHIPDTNLTPRANMDDYSGHFLNFAEGIKYGVKRVAGANSACLSTDLCLMCNIALDLGRPLRWDASSASFAGDNVANNYLRAPMRTPWVL